MEKEKEDCEGRASDWCKRGKKKNEEDETGVKGKK